VHAGSVAETVVRLRELGLELASLESALRIVTAQRLVRRLCTSCGGGGCPRCHETGYRGRSAVGEVVTIGPQGLRSIATGDSAALEAACVREAKMEPMAVHADALVRQRVTTVEETQRVLG